MPLDFESFPMRLFRKSQELAWDAAAIDYSREAEDWQSLDDDERELLLRLTVGFLVGERGVTHDLAPLQQALRRERGRMEEEMYLTAQMFEEARHVEFFQRWFNATLPGVLGTDVPYPKLEGDLFGVRLPAVMRALNDDPSPEAQIRALVTYHLYIEGVGAESSYPLYFDICEGRGIFAALREGITLIRRDEARHIAFGTWVLQRILGENPHLEGVFERELDAFEPYVGEGLAQTFAGFGAQVPFGLDPGKYRSLYRENYALQRDNVYSRELV